MGLADGLIAELEREGASTERILARVPMDKIGWKPHAKSSSLGELAWHIASLPAGAVGMLKDGERDVSQARPSTMPANPDFVATFKQNLAKIKETLAHTEDKTLLNENFAFKNNGAVITSMPKLAMIRTVLLNHSYHHRGQLTVYLRLLDVPVPAMYGRSADENAFERR